MIPLTTRLYVATGLLVAALAMALVPDVREYAFGVAGTLLVFVLEMLRADHVRRSLAPSTSTPLTTEQTHLPREATGSHRLPREHTGQRELERNEDAIPTVRERVDPPTPARPLGTWRDHDPDKTPSETPASKRRDRGTDT